MENIWLFLLTVFAYWMGWWAITSDYGWEFAESKLKALSIIAALAMPFNIDGNVFTVAGNAVAEDSIYSVFSIYQKAEKGTAVVVFPTFSVQEAPGPNGNAISLFGISAYQKAGNLALNGAGINLHQESEGAAGGVAGITVYQKADGEAINFFGITVYQEAEEKGYVATMIGVGIFQKAGENTRAFGVFIPLYGYTEITSN